MEFHTFFKNITDEQGMFHTEVLPFLNNNYIPKN